MRKMRFFLVTFTLFLLAQVAQADSIRCGAHIIEDGGNTPPTMEEVIKKCGKPTSREGNILVYEKHGKRLDFDTENRLIAMHDIRNDD